MNRLKMRAIVICLSILLGMLSPVQIASNTGQDSVIQVTKTEAKKKAKMVYITRTGECYHTHKCGNGTYFKTTLKQAKAMGLRKCKKCYR